MFNATTGAEDLTDTSGMFRRNVVQNRRDESLQDLLRELYPNDSSDVVSELSSQLLQIPVSYTHLTLPTKRIV